jgi:ABC-2 type transport system permease protein
VNVRLGALPGWLAAIGRALPLTHGIEAARKLAAGVPLGDVTELLWTEVGIGTAWFASAFVLLRLFEWESRRTAALDRM